MATKVKRKKDNSKSFRYTDFSGIKEQQATGELPFKYLKNMINCRLDDDLNIRQRDGQKSVSQIDLSVGEQYSDFPIKKMDYFRFLEGDIYDLLSDMITSDYFDYIPSYSVFTNYTTYGIFDIDAGQVLTTEDPYAIVSYKINVIQGRTYKFDVNSIMPVHFEDTSQDPSCAFWGIDYGASSWLEVENTFGAEGEFVALDNEVTIYIMLRTLGYGDVDYVVVNANPVRLFSVEAGNIQVVLQAGTDLFKIFASDLDDDDATMEKINGSVELSSVNDVDFAQLNELLYIFDGSDTFYTYDGETFTEITNGEAYIPTITISRTPDGSSYTEYEELNQISRGFTDSFTSDGTSTDYYISYTTDTGLATDDIVIEVDGVTLEEDVDFSVTRSTGVIDFTGGSAPHGAPAAGSNNVKITGHLDDATDATVIANCRFAIVYSGASDARIFLAGNPQYPNRVYYSDLNNGLYYPLTNSSIVGDSYPIRGFNKQNNELIVVKEKGIYVKEFYNDPTVGVVFTQRTLNSKKGAINFDEIELVNNNPYFLSRSGLYEIIVTDADNDERSVVSRSDDIKRSLRQANLANAILFDYEQEQELYIHIPSFGQYDEGETWIFNYGKNAWYTDYGYSALSFMEYDGNLYFGTAYGRLIKFDEDEFNDLSSSTPIDAYLEFDFYDFETIQYYKKLMKFYMTAEMGSGVRNDVTLLTEEGIEVSEEFNPMFSTIDFGNIDFGNFTFETSYAPNSEVFDSALDKFIFLKVRIRNNYADSKLSVNSFEFLVRYTTLVR